MCRVPQGTEVADVSHRPEPWHLPGFFPSRLLRPCSREGPAVSGPCCLCLKQGSHVEDVNQTSQTSFVSFIKFNFIRMEDGMTASLTLTAKGRSRVEMKAQMLSRSPPCTGSPHGSGLYQKLQRGIEENAILDSYRNTSEFVVRYTIFGIVNTMSAVPFKVTILLNLTQIWRFCFEKRQS